VNEVGKRASDERHSHLNDREGRGVFWTVQKKKGPKIIRSSTHRDRLKDPARKKRKGGVPLRNSTCLARGKKPSTSKLCKGEKGSPGNGGAEHGL